MVEILSSNLECESSLHRRVDLFFLVDSIVQCSRGLKGMTGWCVIRISPIYVLYIFLCDVMRFYKISGDIGAIYPLAIQTVLPRMLSAAAPPGSCSLENQRQCLKVIIIIIICVCVCVFGFIHLATFLHSVQWTIDLMFSLIC